MTDEEYRDTQEALTSMAQMVWPILGRVDIDAFLARIARAEAVGTVLSPTLARDAAPGLAQIKGLARAWRDFKSTLTQLAAS